MHCLGKVKDNSIKTTLIFLIHEWCAGVPDRTQTSCASGGILGGNNHNGFSQSPPILVGQFVFLHKLQKLISGQISLQIRLLCAHSKQKVLTNDCVPILFWMFIISPLKTWIICKTWTEFNLFCHLVRKPDEYSCKFYYRIVLVKFACHLCQHLVETMEWWLHDGRYKFWRKHKLLKICDIWCCCVPYSVLHYVWGCSHAWENETKRANIWLYNLYFMNYLALYIIYISLDLFMHQT